MMNLDAGASKEAPFLVEADASSDSPEEAQPYVYLRGVPGADDWEPALTDLLVLLPWTYAGAIVIDGYWVPYYKRKLGLL